MNRNTARWVLGGVAAAEGLAALARHQRRSTLYARAVKRARATGKQLVVVGDPDAGAHTRLFRAYDCGDLCVDLNSCPACTNAVAVDLTKQQVPVAAGSAVVYVACVLEYTTDPAQAWAEISRMAGTPDDVFMATVQPWTLTAALYPGANYTLTESGQATPVTGAHKIVAVAAVGWLLYKSW